MNHNAVISYQNSTSRSATAIYERRAFEMKLIEELKEEYGYLDTKLLLQELHKHNYNIKLPTLYEDLREINANNTYVLDIATSNYSAKVEYCFGILEKIVRRCEEIDRSKWTKEKTVRRTVVTPEGESVINETSQTQEVAEPHIKALDVQAKAVKCMFDGLKGDVMDTSVGLMLKEFQNLKAWSAELEEKLRQAQNTKVIAHAKID